MDVEQIVDVLLLQMQGDFGEVLQLIQQDCVSERMVETNVDVPVHKKKGQTVSAATESWERGEVLRLILPERKQQDVFFASD